MNNETRTASELVGDIRRLNRIGDELDANLRDAPTHHTREELIAMMQKEFIKIGALLNTLQESLGTVDAPPVVG